MRRFQQNIDTPRSAHHSLAGFFWGALVFAVLSGVSPLTAFLGARPSPTAAQQQTTTIPAGQSRRMVLGGGVMGAIAPAMPAVAAEFPGLGKTRGPFEVDAKDAVIVGDANSDAAKAAKAKIIALQTEAESALAKLEANPQEDLTGMIDRFGIADLREATNTVNNLMDESTAAGTQRLQRLMMQAKYQYEDDIPFPVSKKGVPQPRGEKRLARIKKALEDYIKNSKELLKFI